MASTTYAAWSTIAPITIANAPGVADYPVRVDLTYAAEMAADFSDIRFVDASDNALSYWIESYTARSSAVVWVKVASGATAISLVYGNAAASSESNGANVFSFFDDFPGTSLDTTTKWNKDSAVSVAVSGGVLTVTGNGPNNAAVVSSKTTFGAGHAVRTKAKFSNASGGSSCYGWRPADATTDLNFAGAYNTNGYRLTTYVTAYERDSQNADTNWHTLDIARNGSTSVIFKLDSTSATFTATTQIPSGSVPVGFRPYGSGISIASDWILVRKYQATEPVCTVGTAEPNSSGPVVPTAAFSADVLSGPAPLTVAFTDESLDTPTSWDWDFGDGSAHSTAQNPTHAYALPGTYPVTLTVTNDTGSDTETKTGYITVYITVPLPAAMTYATYAEWPYAIEYTIANPPAVDGYQVPLTVAWKPGMRQDFRDLRFRDEGMIPTVHRLESYTAGTTATFLLEIRPGQERLSVLYGNGAAVSASDETFCPVLDAFSGAAVDAGTWTDLGGTAVSGGTLTITGRLGTSGVSSIAALGIGTELRARLTYTPGSTSYTEIGYGGDGSDYALLAYGTTLAAHTRNGATVESTTLALPAGYHTLAIRRASASAVVVLIDGVAVATHDEQIPDAAVPIRIISTYNLGASMALDWITVRPCLAAEPTITYLSADVNPWSPLVNRPSALFDVPFDWSDFTKQKVISFTVRRSAADAMHRAEVQIEGLIPQGTDYQQVHLLVPDHRDPEILNRIFYGFLPAQTSRMAVAANKTSYAGYSYDFYLSAMKVHPAALVMPSTTNPATWIASAVGVGAADILPTHDLTNVHAPAAWGTTSMPAREFVIPSGSSRWQAWQKVADELGLILTGKWLDAGSTPTHGHQDPALRIIRVEAEDYDAGGEGGGYHDTTAANLGGAYRKDGVDIEYFQSEAGYNVGWIRDGEWLRYTVAIPVAGNWTAKFRTASAAITGARSFKVYWGTNPASLTEIEDIAVDGTGSYSSFKWNTDVATLPVATAGTHYLKLLFDNAGDDVSDLLHMNIAAIDLYPPPGAGAAENIVPALYLCDEADIDGPNGLDLPPTAVIPVYDPTLAGEVRYVEDFGSVANTVVIQYRTTAAPDDIVSYTVFPDDLTPPQTSTLEGWIDHYEEIRTPITAAVAEAYGKALLASLLESWGTVTANFVKRSDLQLYQKIRFEGHENIPEIDYRIVDISYSVALADVRCSITAIPARKFSVEKQLARARAPDPATEIEAIARSVLKSLPPALTGTAGSVVGTGSVAVALDRGGTITARGVAASGSRVLCTWAEGIGYVASVIAAAP